MPESTLEQKQRTLARPASLEGVGLFSGRPVTVTLRPAPADHGVVFRRVDLPGSPLIPVRIDHVVDRARRTAIKAPASDPEQGGPVVETVEHCLSALAGLGVDNALIELDAEELPIGDGSALPFIELIERAGVDEQDAPRRPLVVTEPVTVRAPAGAGIEGVLIALPNDAPALELVYDLDFGSSGPLRRQVAAFTLAYAQQPAAFAGVMAGAAHGPGSNGAASAVDAFRASPYITDVAPARSFALLAEAQAMRAKGLFAHVSPRDMLVIGDEGPVDNEYRFADEPARHKLLDLLGDLALAGRPIQGRIIASRSGHALNQRLARALVEQARRRERFARRLGDVGAQPAAMDIKDVLRLLPHRYPMVLVDRVLEIDGDRRAVGIKNVTVNEPFFQGHYPGSPIMPGVLIVEAMSQLAGLMLSQKLERTGKIAVLLSMDRVKLRKPVHPGDQLVMETETIKASERFGDVQCKARVDGRLVAEARVKFMMVDAEAER
ncbi:MAG: 3-hydroxyacyl-ACP dehydratase FabZ [Phycisphaerales bacterium]|nr:3-hydroxyacyl-ACP dehydratase FabZ [Phycisphaerales bacterium]